MSYYIQAAGNSVQKGLEAIAAAIKSRPAPVTYNIIVNTPATDVDALAEAVQAAVERAQARQGTAKG